MNSYNNKGGRSGGYSGGYNNRRDSGPREMHKATCDECGNTCEVPFRPSGNKPVYCSNCFETKGGGSSRDSRGPRRSGGRSSGRSDYEGGDKTSKQLLEQVTWLNSKLDRVLKVLETGVKTDSPKKKPKVKKTVKKVAPKVKKAKKTSKKK